MSLDQAGAVTLDLVKLAGGAGLIVRCLCLPYEHICMSGNVSADGASVHTYSWNWHPASRAVIYLPFEQAGRTRGGMMLKIPGDTRRNRPVVSNGLKPELVFLRGGDLYAAGGDLHSGIKKILAQPKARCAVAFWGQGSEKLVTGTGSRVICNLRTGGTNPYALQKVNAELRQSDYLHAKVYIGREEAIVASANVSANGLGLENVEQECWIEAGAKLSDISAVSDWFEALWEQSRGISPEDWEAAKRA